MTTKAVATVLGGFWETQAASPLSSISGKGSARRMVAQILGDRGLLAMRALMTALDGVAPGATATKNLTRIASSDELGGVRAIETVALVNRATVAGDVTEIEADFHTLSTRTYTANPVANLDQNPLGTR